MHIKIYQNYFLPEQLDHLDPALVPYDNTSNEEPQLREYPIIRKLYDEQPSNPDYYWGVMSWKFTEKTRITGQQFTDWIGTNAGYDMYFAHPLVALENIGRYRNPFAEAEQNNRGITAFIDSVMHDILKLPTLEIRTMSYHPRHFSYCSFYVGNSTFWDKWIPFADNIISEVKKTPKLNAFLFESSISHHELGKKVKLINFSFVMERLVNLFTHLHFDQLRIHYYPLPDDPMWGTVVREKEQGVYRDAYHVPSIFRR
jgi:hypothetical protein